LLIFFNNKEKPMQKHYYAVTDAMPDAEGDIIVVTTPVSIFDADNCLSDRYDPELNTAFESMGIGGGELMDSHFEVSSPSDIHIVKTKLEAHPDFIANGKFEDFALNFEE
jgi:hypothetical protein